MGTSLMRPAARRHAWAVYAWCRRTDDIVDSPRALMNREVLQSDLTAWSQRLDRIFVQEPTDLFDIALVDTVKEYPSITIQPYRDMIAGMLCCDNMLICLCAVFVSSGMLLYPFGGVQRI